MQILTLSGKEKNQESPEDFKQRVKGKTVSKFVTGSIHIQSGNYTSEEEKEARRQKIAAMDF